MLENILLFILAATFLVVSGIYLVKSLVKISISLGISKFSAAFILMAFATSIPELFVGISSAIQGIPQLSMGNVIGANIIDLTLLTGLFILLGRGIKFKTQKIDKEIYFMFLGILLLIVLYLIGNSLCRIDGVILLGLFAINTIRLMKKREKYPAKIKKEKRNKKSLIYLLIFIISLIVLFISSKYVVKYAEMIAVGFGLPEIFIGIFLISIATTLPELIFGVNAILLGHKEMSIGDQAGTVFTNICLVLGIVAIIHPITVSITPFLISGIFMLICGFLFLSFIKSGKKLEMHEGLALIGLYLFFVFLQFLTRSIL